MTLITRRGIIMTGALGAGGAMLSGCDKLFAVPSFKQTLQGAEGLHLASQRLLTGGALAPEFTAQQMSPNFRTNGNTTAQDQTWLAQSKNQFADYALKIDGLVRRPLSLPLSALKTMPQRRQITRHDCVEGWSAIGMWQGPQLGTLLRNAGVLPQARYLVFHCADNFGANPYYESIDLTDAFHPQTILAWQMNGQPLTIGHGAPLRLRVERQLGYKQAKYIMRIEARANLAGLYGGKGGYWEDNAGYQWYAGI